MLQNACLAKVFAQQLEELAGARLKDLAYHALRHQARRPVADRRDFYLIALRNQRGDGVTEISLETLGFPQCGAHANREIAREVVAADRNDCGMRDRTCLKTD